VKYPATEFDIQKLEKGRSYQFSVAAENVHGESEPLVTETATKAANPFSQLLRAYLCLASPVISPLVFIE